MINSKIRNVFCRTYFCVNHSLSLYYKENIVNIYYIYPVQLARSFADSGPSTWNSLPPSIRAI